MPNPENKKNHNQHGAVKADSIFLSIAPPSPEPRSEPRPAAAPAVAPEQLTALKARLELLEKNIAALIEQKPAAPAALETRLDSLERNLTALVEKKLSGIEASVGGAAEKRTDELLAGFAGLAERLDGFRTQGAAQAGELEKYGAAVKNAASELLKALADRQKSSELDQRLHSQLEKSWTHAEALEKKLGEAFRVATEAQLKGNAEKKAGVDALAEFGRKMELLRLKGEETVQQLSGAGVKMDKMAEIMDRIDPEKYEVHLKQLHGELSGMGQAFNKQAEHFRGKFLDFNLLAEDFKTSSQTLEAGLKKVVNGNEQLLAAALENIGAIIDKSLTRFMVELQEKNRQQFAQLSANYDRALDTLSKVGSVCSSIEYVSKRLEGYGKTLSNFVAQVGGGDRLSSLTGVSGIVVRENFGALTAMAADLKREKEYLEAARNEIADKTNRVISGGSCDPV